MTVTTRRQEARRNSQLDNPELDDTSEPGNIVLANPPEDLLETVINTWGQRASRYLGSTRLPLPGVNARLQYAMRLIVLVNIIFGILEDSVITTISTRLHLPEPPRTPTPIIRQIRQIRNISNHHHLADIPGGHHHGGGSFFL